MSSSKVKCTCGWSWNKSDSSKKDMYICHECGRDNSNNMKNGGWLDNYNDSQASAPEGMVGDGFSNVGRNYSPAWGGQFQMGGDVYPVNYVPQAQMGGTIAGAPGFSYARTQGAAPSNGKYAKKTMASAQDGLDSNKLLPPPKNINKPKDVRKPGESIKLSGFTNPGEVNYAPYTPTLEGLNKAKTKTEKEATKKFIDWYSDPATKAKFQKNTGFDPERMQDLIGKGLNTPMSLYDRAIKHDWPMEEGADAAYKSAWVSQQQGDPTAPKTGYISYLPQGADIPEMNVYSRPLKDMIGHELAHASGFDTTLAPALYRALGLKLPTKAEQPDLAYPSRYMQRPEEVYGNFHELRLNLGLTPGEKVDRESLKKRVKADPHNATNFWDYYSKDPKTGKEDDKKIDKIVKAINTVAQVESTQQDPNIQTAQNGKEMSYYQNGLDWKPKSISRDGAWLDNYEEAQTGKNVKFDAKKFAADKKRNTPLQKSIDKEAQSEDNRRWTDSKEYKDKVKANKLAEDKATIQDRKDRIKNSEAAQKKSFTKDNWRQQLADETQATGDKFRMFPEDPDSFVDEWMNPGVMIGNMASDLGSAPLRAQQEDSYMPYVTSIGVPLLTGGLEGLGAKTTKQFVSNLANPFNIVPGYKSVEKSIGKALGTESGLLSNAYKLNPYAFKANPEMGYRMLGREGFQDAVETGVLRAKPIPNQAPSGGISLTRNTNRNPNTGKMQGALDRPYFADGVIDERYAADYMAAVNKAENNLVPIATHRGIAPSQAGSIPLENATLYKKNWWQGYKEVPKQEDGGIIKDDRGQWDHPGEVTEIGSNDITMEGVPYDVLGISDTGDVKLMKPGKNYKFKGKKVTEYPMAKNGMRQEQKGLQNLDNLTNFTNYNKPQPGGWLNKYN